MKAATLAVVCVFMTLALALTASGMGYGSYMPYYGSGYGSKGGFGDGGFCKSMYFVFINFFIYLFAKPVLSKYLGEFRNTQKSSSVERRLVLSGRADLS